jgi:hypothetical protein
MRKKAVADLLKLIEGLPLHDYTARDADRILAAWLAERPSWNEREKQSIAECIRMDMISIPGEPLSHLYGHGILLKKNDRDRLIKCLKSLVSGRRGRPTKDADEKLTQAFADRAAFEKVLAEIQATGRKRGAKTRVYEILEKKWHLTNRAVRLRVKAALELAPF